MIVHKAIGNRQEERFASLRHDIVSIEWYNTHKAVDLRMSAEGKEIGMRPDDDTIEAGWRAGDVLWVDDDECLVVEIPATACLSLRPKNRRQMILACYEIGNRHAPLFYGDVEGELLTPSDEPLARLLRKHGLKPRIGDAVLSPDRRISQGGGHDHGQNHGHSHDHGHSHGAGEEHHHHG